MSDRAKLLIVVIAIQPFFIIAGITFYYQGIKRYGEPEEYRRMQIEMLQAAKDSLAAVENVVSPETVGDSTMVGLDMHRDIFSREDNYENRISTLKATLDSIGSQRNQLVTISEDIDRKRQLLDDLGARAKDEKIVNLSKIYDGMKPLQSVPLFVEMEDTLAVLIISNMSQRSSARLLGALAQEDIDKAARITKLLSVMGIEGF